MNELLKGHIVACIYYGCVFTRDLLIIQTKIIEQIVFAVSVPNVWEMIDVLVTQGLQL